MSRMSVFRVVGVGILAAGAIVSACEKDDLGQLLRSQVVECPSDQCTDPSPPGDVVVCEDLSTAGPACVSEKDGSCGWVILKLSRGDVVVRDTGHCVGDLRSRDNSALVDPGADPCCAWVGGPNNCDQHIACNDMSGSQCCLIYATSATVSSNGCCLYENGSTPATGPGADRTEECGDSSPGPRTARMISLIHIRRDFGAAPKIRAKMGFKA